MRIGKGGRGKDKISSIKQKNKNKVRRRGGEESKEPGDKG